MTRRVPSTNQRKRSKRAQIVDHLRSAIASGEYPPGSQLPSTQELAASWSTQVTSAHRAMTQLASEGWLERVPRIGTFVLQPPRTLTSVGIYIPMDVRSDRATRFSQVFSRLLEDALAAEGLKSMIWIDPESDVSKSPVWENVRREALERRIDGLIMPHADIPHIRASGKLPIPVAIFGGGITFSGAVLLDMERFLRDGVAALAQAGCRRVGLISAAERSPTLVDVKSTRPGPDSAEVFQQCVQAAGLVTQPSWILTPPEGSRVPETEAEHFGHDAFLRLWAEDERPDGLLVFTDVAARGVLLALAQHQVRVPDSLQLVLHRNLELGLLCPMPATFVDVHVAEAAALSLRQLKSLHQGLPTPLVHLPFHLSNL